MQTRWIRSAAQDQDKVNGLLRIAALRDIASTADFLARATGAEDGEASPVPIRKLVPGVEVQPVTLHGVPCEYLRGPGARTDKIIVYLHGGAFTRGSLALGRPNAAFVAMDSGLTVLAVGYRQAPAHPFPAAVDDVAQVYQALLQSRVAPENVVVFGESSGGCLALGLAVSLDSARDQLPAGIAALSPLVDLLMRGASWVYNAHRDVATRELGSAALDLYIDPSDRSHPVASPVEHHFQGSCPLWLGIGSAETMLSDVERLALRASGEGAAVHLQIYDAMLHGFSRVDCDTADQSLRDVSAWCAQRLRVDSDTPAPDVN